MDHNAAANCCVQREGIAIIDSNTNSAKRKKARNHRRKIRKHITTAACALAGFLMVIIAVLLLLPTTPGDTAEEPIPPHVPAFSFSPKIPTDTTIAGIDVGGMTEEKATELLENTLPNDHKIKNMVVVYGARQVALSPETTKAHCDIQSAVTLAMSGKSSSVTVPFQIDEKAIRNELQQFFASLGGIYSPSGAWLEGPAPDWDENSQPSQMLVLVPGSTGLQVDLEAVIEQILEAYQSNTFRIVLKDAGEIRGPEILDIHKIYGQLTIPPIEPSLNKETMEIIPGKNGFGFDVTYASEQLEKSVAGEPVRIPMHYLPPTLSESDVWYLDTLGYCKTEHTDNENRNENLRLACKAINGIILQPGDTFSYNATLGERTQAAGYKPAPAYAGVDLVDEIGGGICQVSSTLYLSALFAELRIVERKNHGFPVSYIPLGLDATVNWGTTDLKFRNEHEYPVKILAEVSDGYVKVRITGVDLRDYYVKMEYRVDDHPDYASAYKCKYRKETDEEISRVLDHTSIYLEEVWCWPGYIQNAIDEEPTTAEIE